ncbi:MAG: hypothetical protein QW755_07635 [Nitrososphaerota archaeon]
MRIIEKAVINREDVFNLIIEGIKGNDCGGRYQCGGLSRCTVE